MSLNRYIVEPQNHEMQQSVEKLHFVIQPFYEQNTSHSKIFGNFVNKIHFAKFWVQRWIFIIHKIRGIHPYWHNFMFRFRTFSTKCTDHMCVDEMQLAIVFLTKNASKCSSILSWYSFSCHVIHSVHRISQVTFDAPYSYAQSFTGLLCL